MGRNRTPARMTRLVTRWRASGESGASFARRHHIPAWTFWYWCRKLAVTSRTESGDAAPTFVPGEMPASGLADGRNDSAQHEDSVDALVLGRVSDDDRQ